MKDIAEWIEGVKRSAGLCFWDKVQSVRSDFPSEQQTCDSGTFYAARQMPKDLKDWRFESIFDLADELGDFVKKRVKDEGHEGVLFVRSRPVDGIVESIWEDHGVLLCIRAEVPVQDNPDRLVSVSVSTNCAFLPGEVHAAVG